MFPQYSRLIGFKDLFDQFATQTEMKYPPYNIIKTQEDNFRIEIAVAGFDKDEITVTQVESQINVSGAKKNKDNNDYVYNGISTRKFDRKFLLADHLEVKKVDLENGILVIDLERNIPEEKKPKVWF